MLGVPVYRFGPRDIELTGAAYSGRWRSCERSDYQTARWPKQRQTQTHHWKYHIASKSCWGSVLHAPWR